MLQRAPLSLRSSAYVRRLATSSSSPSSAKPTSEEDGQSSGFFSSWVGKIKNAFQSKASPPTATDSPAAPLTLLACADQLKKASRLANLSSLLKLNLGVSQQPLTENLEKFSTIYRALGKYNPTGQNVDSKQKAMAAEECSCTVQEVEKALTAFGNMKMLETKIKQMQDRGEKIPKTMEEMSKLVERIPSEQAKGMAFEHKVNKSQNMDIGRNAPCSCGSGKKFKRCCGRGK